MAERRTNAARNEANPNAQQLAQGAPRPLPKFRTQGGARSIPSLLAIGIAVVAAGAGYHTGRQRGLQESLRGLSARPHFLVDLSVSLKAGIPSDPPGAQPSISYEDHHQSVKHLQMFFPGLLKEQLPDGEGWAIERLETTTHTGTHMDACVAFMMQSSVSSISPDLCMPPLPRTIGFSSTDEECENTEGSVDARVSGSTMLQCSSACLSMNVLSLLETKRLYLSGATVRS